jgi:5-methylcytosine-specific restriction endonuclease McrA
MKPIPSLSKTIRQLVWNRYIGARWGWGYCWSCNSTMITAFEYECGHVMARSKGGEDTVENLRPICGLCNRSMGTENMMDWMNRQGLGGGGFFKKWWPF